VTETVIPQTAPVTPPTSNPWVPMWNLGPTAYDLRYNGDYTPGSYTDGDIVVYNGVTYLCVRPTSAAPTPWTTLGASPQPSVRVYRSTTQAAGSAVFTAISFDTVRYDRGPSVHWASGTPTRLTCQVAGFYQVTGHIDTAAITTNQAVILDILLNGSVEIARHQLIASNTTGTSQTITAGTYLNVGDYVELRVYQNTGASLNVSASSPGLGYASDFEMALVGGQPGPPGPATPVTYSTSLPTNPVDGQEAILVDSITNPSYQWRFRYNAGSTSAFKWEFVGGTDAFGRIDANESSATVNTWMDMATPGPLVTLSRPGDYQIMAGLIGGHTVVNALMYVAIANGTSGTQGPSRGWYGNLGGGSSQVAPSVIDRIVGCVATDLRLRYYNASTGTMNVNNRWIAVRPIRVS